MLRQRITKTRYREVRENVLTIKRRNKTEIVNNLFRNAKRPRKGGNIKKSSRKSRIKQES